MRELNVNEIKQVNGGVMGYLFGKMADLLIDHAMSGGSNSTNTMTLDGHYDGFRLGTRP